MGIALIKLIIKMLLPFLDIAFFPPFSFYHLNIYSYLFF